MIHHDLSNPFQASFDQRFNEVFSLAKETDFFLELMQKQPANSDFLNTFTLELEQYYQEKSRVTEEIKTDLKSTSIKELLFISERCEAIFQRLLRKTTLETRERFRIEILLKSINPVNTIRSIAKQLNTTRKTVRKWLTRFVNYSIYLELPCVKSLKKSALTKFLLFILKDAPRSGRPVVFSPELLIQMFCIACEKPGNSGRPISQWSAREIADELMKRNLVETISERQVKRFLENVDLKPHLSRYWCNSPEKEKPEFEEKIRLICELYRNATLYAKQNIRVLSMDEKTGIQAVERSAPTKTMKPGRVEQREHNYIRHGTRCLIAGLEVSTGEIIEPFLNATRKEKDWVTAIQLIVATNPTAKYVFVVDQLNTHKSESLVRYIADFCQLPEDLGVKGKSGVLQNQATRQQFLENSTHQISFVFTPKHASWMNQIEIWFSILSRKLLKRGSFPSVAQLETTILQFIDYYNYTMARPFKWNYKGRPLTR